jgi:ferritin
VTASINTIYEEAIKVKDFRTQQFLDWFIKEQGEEEMNAQENIQKFEVFGSDARGLYLLNQELAARTFAPPSLVL